MFGRVPSPRQEAPILTGSDWGASAPLFKAFFHPDEAADSTARGPAQDFYALLKRMREAVKSRSVNWASYAPLVAYADACFWTIRKLEYSFAVHAFASIEDAVRRPLDVLDVGCGVVPLCNWISLRGHRVRAVDAFEPDVRCLAQNGVNDFYKSRASYLAAAAEYLPFGTECFDVVTCISVLEHLPPGHDRAALWEIARVLKPGGQLILTFDVAPGRNPGDDQVERPVHLRAPDEPFSPQSARRLLTHLGRSFKVEPTDLPGELETLSWDDVREFWSATQTDDGREQAVRNYLAIGGTIERRRDQVEPTLADHAEAHQEAIGALIASSSYYQRHATARLAELEVQRRAAEERLALIQELDRQLQSRKSTPPANESMKITPREKLATRVLRVLRGFSGK